MADYKPLPNDVGPPVRTVSTAESESDEEHRCSCKVIVGFLVVIALLVGLVYIGVAHQQEIGECWHSFLLWCHSLGWKAALVVALSTWLATSFGLPASAFFVGSAAVFANLYGPTTGALVAIASCGAGFWAGCVTAFVLARHVLKPMVQKKLDGFKAMRAVNMIIEEEGWRFAFLMRLSPFMPVEVFNFACALTSMSFRDNTLACFGSLPVASFEIWMYAQVAHAAMKRHSSSSGGDSDNSQIIIMIAVNIPIIILIVVVVRHANKKYHEKVDSQEADEVKETLKNRKSVHRSLKKASTIVSASKLVGTHQAVTFTVQSIRRQSRTARIDARCKTMPPLKPGTWPELQSAKREPLTP